MAAMLDSATTTLRRQCMTLFTARPGTGVLDKFPTPSFAGGGYGCDGP
jgi:hypothetical protein